jgi:hypothetical protein
MVRRRYAEDLLDEADEDPNAYLDEDLSTAAKSVFDENEEEEDEEEEEDVYGDDNRNEDEADGLSHTKAKAPAKSASIRSSKKEDAPSSDEEEPSVASSAPAASSARSNNSSRTSAAVASSSFSKRSSTSGRGLKPPAASTLIPPSISEPASRPKSNTALSDLQTDCRSIAHRLKLHADELTHLQERTQATLSDHRKKYTAIEQNHQELRAQVESLALAIRSLQANMERQVTTVTQQLDHTQKQQHANQTAIQRLHTNMTDTRTTVQSLELGLRQLQSSASDGARFVGAPSSRKAPSSHLVEEDTGRNTTANTGTNSMAQNLVQAFSDVFAAPRPLLASAKPAGGQTPASAKKGGIDADAVRRARSRASLRLSSPPKHRRSASPTGHKTKRHDTPSPPPTLRRSPRLAAPRTALHAELSPDLPGAAFANLLGGGSLSEVIQQQAEEAAGAEALAAWAYDEHDHRSVQMLRSLIECISNLIEPSHTQLDQLWNRLPHVDHVHFPTADDIPDVITRQGQILTMLTGLLARHFPPASGMHTHPTECGSDADPRFMEAPNFIQLEPNDFEQEEETMLMQMSLMDAEEQDEEEN